jgi:integrase/recombinase XerD
MRLHDLVETYIAYKRSLGMRYRSQAAVLRAYGRAMGDVAIQEVKPESVLAFIRGTRPVTFRFICPIYLHGR